MSIPAMNSHNFKITKIPQALKIGCWIKNIPSGIPGYEAAMLGK
jgi:hypothetical protein